MSQLNPNVFASDVFTFEIGQDGKEYYVHTGALVPHSQDLKSLMTGEMREANEKRAKFEDVNTETFERVLQFAYTGVYTSARPSCSKKCDDHTLTICKKFNNEDYERTSTMDKKKEWASHLLKIFQEKPPRECIVPQHPHECDSFSETFLCHAQLDVFADYWGMPVLKSLALCSLQHVLLRFEPSIAHCEDFVPLLRYAFKHAPDNTVDKDDLQHEVMYYGACIFRNLAHTKGFMDALKDEPSLAVELLGGLHQLGRIPLC